MSTPCPPSVLCARPGDVRAASQDLKRLVSGLEPDAVVIDEAPEVWAEFDAIERVIASAKLLMARRVEEARTWQRQGFRSAVEQLAVLSGTSMSSARSMLQTSKHIADLPETAEVMRSGELSVAMTQAVVSAAAVAPDAEAQLLATAVRSPLAKLRDVCLKARAGASQDVSHAWIRRERYLREFIDAEGAWNLHARGTVDDGARFRAAIEPLIDGRFNTNRAVEQREPREAHAFDALIELQPHPARPTPSRQFGRWRSSASTTARCSAGPLKATRRARSPASDPSPSPSHVTC